MARFNKEKLSKGVRVVEAGALVAGLARGILAPDSAVAAQDSQQKFRKALLPEGGHTQVLSAEQMAKLRPDREKFLFPDSQHPSIAESNGNSELLQQQENAPAVVPEFPLTPNDLAALEAYFQQEYGVSLEEALNGRGYVIFDLDIAADGSLPIAFDAEGPLSQQLMVVLNAINQVDPNHTAIGLQMNLGRDGGQNRLGFSIVYQEQVGLRPPGAQEYLDPDNQFRYLEGVRDDTEIVLFRVDQATSEQIGNLASVENGVTTPINAPPVGSLMLLERYPDDYEDESKRGVVVSFIVGNIALVIDSEVSADLTLTTAQAAGEPVATPPVNSIALMSYSPGGSASQSEADVPEGESAGIWERYGVSEDVYNDVLFDYPRDILERLTLPEGDPNRMTYSAEYGTVVDSQGRAWFPDIAPAGSPEDESYVTLMDTFVDTENNITYNLFMNPEAYSDRRTAPFNASRMNFADAFRNNISEIDSEFLEQWSGWDIQFVMMANYNSSRRSEEGEALQILGEHALGIEVQEGSIVIRIYEGDAEQEDLDFHRTRVSATIAAALALLKTIHPEGPPLQGDYVADVYKRGQGGWRDNVYQILTPLMEYDAATRSYSPLIDVE